MSNKRLKSPINDHPAQKKIWLDRHRFIMLCAGRRWGKTYLACEKLLKKSEKRRSLNIYTGPTRQQTKDVLWDHLKSRITRLRWDVKINEAELKITRSNGSRILLRSAEKPDRLRGLGIDFIVMDEFAEYRDVNMWGQIVRPALSDKQGEALFIFTPKGYNMAYELFQKAKSEPEWTNYSFKTVDSPFFQTPEGREELRAAKESLSEKDYKQEYEAEFQSFSGLIYYGFNRERNHTDYTYNKDNGPIIIGADFNRSPMAWVMFQKIAGKLYAFDELFIKFSNTEECCRIVRQKYKTNDIEVRPDATGKRKTSNSALSDFDHIRRYLTENINVGNLNPRIVDRWASVNKSFEKKDVYVNTKLCENYTKDLETLVYKEGTCEANLSNPMAGHSSDAGGYAIYREFPILLRRKSEIINL